MSTAKPIEIDLTPILEFQYIQISNFSFQYLLLDKNNKALHTPYECKDYLQDIFWSEITKHSANIWGIHWKPGMVDLNQKTYKLAMLGASDHKLSERIEPMKLLLNTFEKALKFKKTTIVPSTNPDYIVVKFSKDWLESPLLLSAYTTLIRLSGDYHGEDPLEYLKRLKGTKGNPESLPNYMRVDVRRIESSINKFAALLQGMKPTKTWESMSSTQQAHDSGICDSKEFPVVSI